MEFTVAKKHLSRALDLCRSAIDTTASHPAARSILFTAQANKLKSFATSINLNVITFSECDVKAEGSVVLGADRFRSMVRQMPDGAQLKIKVDPKHRAILTAAGSQLRYQMSGQSAEDFPQEPELPKDAKEFLVPAPVLRESLIRVHGGVGDEGRPELWGVTIETTKDHLNAVALHGHKMFLLEHKRSFTHECGGRFFITEPAAKPVLALAQNDEVTIRVVAHEDRVFCIAGDSTVCITCPVGWGPNWQDALKSYQTDSIICRADVEILLQAVRAVTVAAPTTRKEERFPPVEIEVSQKDKSLRIELVNSTDAMDAVNTVEVDALGDMKIKVEPTYLIEALEAAGTGIAELRYAADGVHSPLIIIKDDRKDNYDKEAGTVDAAREVFSAFIALRG